jgi:hypothetical protein
MDLATNMSKIRRSRWKQFAFDKSCRLILIIALRLKFKGCLLYLRDTDFFEALGGVQPCRSGVGTTGSWRTFAITAMKDSGNDGVVRREERRKKRKAQGKFPDGELMEPRPT